MIRLEHPRRALVECAEVRHVLDHDELDPDDTGKSSGARGPGRSGPGLRRTLWGLVFVLCLVGLPALAAALWITPAADISSAPGLSYAPSVVMGPDGSATAVWLNDPGSGVVTVHSSHRTGSTWDGDAEIAGADVYSMPSVVVDGDGVVTAAWARQTGTNTVVESRRRTADGWGPAETIYSVSGSQAMGVQLGVDARGVVTAVFNDPTTSPPGFAWFSKYSGGAWQLQVGMSVGLPDEFRVAQNAAGRMAVVWTQGGSVRVMQYADGFVGTLGPISGSGTALTVPDVVMDGDGTATAIWAADAGGGVKEVRWSRSSWTAQPGAAAVLAAAGTSTDIRPAAAVDSTGVVTAVWTDSAALDTRASRFSGSTWSAPVSLGPSGDSYADVAVDPRGVVTAAWTGVDERGDVALRTARFTGSTWGATTTLGRPGIPAGYNVSLAVDRLGGVTAAWESLYDAVNTLYRVQSQQFASAPGAPTGATAVAGNAAATVSWVRPARDGGVPITSYVVAASDGRSGCTATAPATSCAVTGLTNGTGYTFTVRAVNAAGTGEPSAPTATVVPAPPPAALTATLLPSRTRLVSGQSMRLGIRAANSGGAAAATVRSCVRLPAQLVVVRAPGALRAGGTVCFRIASIAAGQSATRTLAVRAVSTRAVTRRITGSASAPGLPAAAAGPRTVRITPRHRAVPVTG